MRKARATRMFWAALLAAMATAGSAFAGDAQRAEALFNEGKKLMDAKKFADACPKFAESNDLDPALGTRLNLARCYELWGKTATAVAEYQEVVRNGGGDQKRVATAQARIKALEPDLSKLTLMGEFPDGAVIRIDGKIVPGVKSGEEFPVDPGHHVIEISAPEKISRTIEFEADAGLPASLGLPTLEDAPAPEPPPQAAKPAAPPPSTPVEAPPPTHALAPDDEDGKSKKEGSSDGKRLAGWLTIGGGLVALNVGATFGVLTLGNANDVKSLCGSGACPNQAAIDKNQAAKTQALMADIFLPAGAVLVGVGTILVATSSSKPAEKAAHAALRVVPSFGSNGGALSLSGAF